MKISNKKIMDKYFWYPLAILFIIEMFLVWNYIPFENQFMKGVLLIFLLVMGAISRYANYKIKFFDTDMKYKKLTEQELIKIQVGYALAILLILGMVFVMVRGLYLNFE